MSISEVAFADAELRGSVSSALRAAAPHAALTSSCGGQGMTEAHWALAIDGGWTGAFVPETDGGLGLDAAHVADLCEEMGRQLFCGPFIETAVLLPALAREVDGFLPDLLSGVVAGTVRVGYAERDPVGPAVDVDWISPVEHGAQSTHLVVFEDVGPRGLEILIADAPSFADVEVLRPMDPTTSVARIRLAAPKAVERFTLAPDTADGFRSLMHIAIAADLLGVGEAALERAVNHANTRVQFGRAIGSFQAVKHRLADCRTSLMGARLAIAHAVRPGAGAEDARLARILAAETALECAAAAIQTHGGLGISWELDVHLYLKRARRLNARNGGTAKLRVDAGSAFVNRVLTTCTGEMLIAD
jgi:alkylation response protein AidB-like acyl-CoA dehydrogenase